MRDEALVTMERLDDQIEWYDSKSQSNQKLFKLVKALQLAAAAGIPVVAALDGEIPNWVFAALGGLVLILEGVQQLYQYQQNWINYRSTCEALKHEKYLFLANSGPYRSTDNPIPLLAERIEGLISQEHAKWVSAAEHQQDWEEKQ